MTVYLTGLFWANIRLMWAGLLKLNNTYSDGGWGVGGGAEQGIDSDIPSYKDRVWVLKMCMSMSVNKYL